MAGARLARYEPSELNGQCAVRAAGESWHRVRLYGLVKMLERSLTCVRALPGFRVTTLALAAPVMTAVIYAVSHGGREEQAGGVIGLAQAGYHHGSWEFQHSSEH